MKFLDANWFEEHKKLALTEFCEKNRNNVELVEVYENCYGEDKTIWVYYKLDEGIPVVIDRGEGEDSIPEAQFRVFGDYQHYVDVCEGRLDPNKGIITGKFTLEGNLMKAMGMLGTYARVTAAKKIPGMLY